MQPITYEQVLALFAESREQLRLSSLEADKEFAAMREQQRISSEKADKEIAAMREQHRISSERTDKQIAATEKLLANLAVQVGGITDTLGRFAEEQVRPKILELFKERGITLEEAHHRVRVMKNGEFFLEIDLLLVNTIYSVVVEVKNTLRQRDVEEHLERLEKLQHFPSRAIKGTTMFGAVAGMVVAEEVEKFAIKKGLFVLKPKGDNIEISNLDNFKPATWDIDIDAGK